MNSIMGEGETIFDLRVEILDPRCKAKLEGQQNL